jgi:hypothetical protein
MHFDLCGCYLCSQQPAQLFFKIIIISLFIIANIL